MSISSNHQILIIIIIGIIVIVFLYNRSEGFNSLSATEAVNNIASLYNTGTLTATNISATGDVNATGLNMTVGPPTGTNPNQWIFHTPTDYRKSLFIARRKDDNSDWNWGSGINIDSGGSVTSGGNVNTAGDVNATGNVNATGLNMTVGPPTGTNPNRWIFHTPTDYRKSLFIARRKDDNSDWEWGSGINIDSGGNLKVAGNITALGAQVPPINVDWSTPQSWEAYADTAVTKFKISEPIGTIKKIIFMNGGHEVTYIKKTATTILALNPSPGHIRNISNP
jgi:hypothetical protein